MSDDTEYRARDPLIGHLDQAAEQMRQANHHTYTAREVTDLYPVLGALHALFARFDQVAGYLHATVQQADAVDFRHDQDEDVALVLTAVEDDITQVQDLTAQTTASINDAWQQLSHLALDIPELVCPECGEPVHRGTPTDLAPPNARPRSARATATPTAPSCAPSSAPAVTSPPPPSPPTYPNRLLPARPPIRTRKDSSDGSRDRDLRRRHRRLRVGTSGRLAPPRHGHP